ncbi:MAG: response regulator transcription factor [Sterolibacterium sp.]|nr:response regulator transcription factor [Sterolibacterium sp.]
MKLLIVEDHILVREGLLHTLKKLGDDIICKGAENSDAALALLEEEKDAPYDLCLLDLMLPGLNGIGFLGVLRKRFPDLPVVILSALDDNSTIERTIRAGAAGFISKASPSEVLLHALRTVLDGDVYVPLSFQGKTVIQKNGRRKRGIGSSFAEQYNLTAAQMRVLELLGQGKTNRQISELLNLTEGTVKVHVSAILKSLNVDNRSMALLLIKEHKSNKL